MYQLSTLAVPTNHHLRIRTFGLCLADELCHQFAAVSVAAGEEALNGGGIGDALDCEVVCSYNVCQSGEEGGPGKRSDVALFCCLERTLVRMEREDKKRHGLTPRAKTTVMALQPVPSVKPFSVVDEPRVLVLFVAAADMNGTESKKRLNEERILKSEDDCKEGIKSYNGICDLKYKFRRSTWGKG